MVRNTGASSGGGGGSASRRSGPDDEVGQRRRRPGSRAAAPPRPRRRARSATDDVERRDLVVADAGARGAGARGRAAGRAPSHSPDLVGRPVALAGRLRSGRASGRWRPRRRRARRRRGPRATTSLHRRGRRHDVVAVDRDVVDAVARGPLLERRRVLGRRRGELGVAVVLAEEDHRQLPHGGEVHRLVERALRRRAVAEERHRDAAVGAELGGRRRADRDRHAGGHDPVGAEDPELGIGDVHRAAAAAVRALRPCPSARRTSRAGRGPWPGSGRGRGGSR